MSPFFNGEDRTDNLQNIYVCCTGQKNAIVYLISVGFLRNSSVFREINSMHYVSESGSHLSVKYGAGAWRQLV